MIFYYANFLMNDSGGPEGVGGGGEGWRWRGTPWFTAVKRVKFAKVKRNTSKLRLLLSLSKV